MNKNRLLLTLLFFSLSAGVPGLFAPTPKGAESPGPAAEIPLSDQPGFDEEDPVAAWGKNSYLTVWQSTRNESSQIFGARLSSSGQLLQRESFPISLSPRDQLFPAISFGADCYLIVWQDLRGGKNWEIYGARIGPDGKRLDSADLPIGTGPGNRKHPAVSWNGRDFLAVWMEERPGTGWDIAGKRISSSGAIVAQDEIAVSVSPGDQTSPAIGLLQKNFLVVWSDNRSGNSDIYGARIDPSGNNLDPAGFAISTAPDEQINPAVASNGNTADVVWADRRKGEVYAVYGARISKEGSLLDPEGIPLAASARNHQFPDIACLGPSCYLSWEEELPRSGPVTGIRSILRDIRGRIWNPPAASLPAGSDTGEMILLREGIGNHFSRVSTDGKEYLIVWKDYRSGPAATYGRLVDPSR